MANKEDVLQMLRDNKPPKPTGPCLWNEVLEMYAKSGPKGEVLITKSADHKWVEIRGEEIVTLYRILGGMNGH
jgi:hypothetical protein